MKLKQRALKGLTVLLGVVACILIPGAIRFCLVYGPIVAKLIIWLVAILVIVVLGWLVAQRLRERRELIRLAMREVGPLTPMKYE